MKKNNNSTFGISKSSYSSMHKTKSKKQPNKNLEDIINSQILQEELNESLDRLKRKNTSQSSQKIEVNQQNKDAKSKQDILIQEQIQEDLTLYQQYRQLEIQYKNQLEQIKSEIQRIQKQCQVQKNRIEQSELNVQKKKKKLKSLQQSYEILAKSTISTQDIQQYDLKLAELKKQYEQAKIKDKAIYEDLENQTKKATQQNQQLKIQLEKLQNQLSQLSQMSQQDYQKQKKNLEQQEKRMIEQVQSLQKQGQNLRKDIQKIQNMKPLSTQMHKKYLDLYQKMFITSQLQIAQQILQAKQNQKRQIQEYEKRKKWIKQKKIQITLKEKHLQQKNKIIDKLTQQIREKSTILLNLYQK